MEMPMIRSMLTTMFVLLASQVHALPEHSPWPGGIGVLHIPGNVQPIVMINEQPALLLRGEDEWIALFGIPLDQDVASQMVALVELPGRETEEILIDIRPNDYREQRLNVDRKYVEPDPEQLERIFAERKIIDAALTNVDQVELSDVSLQAPVAGPRSSSFGLRRFFNDEPRSPHKGMDIAASSGTTIVAPMAGTITATGDFFFNGNTVIIDHGQGFVSLYCHLSEIDSEEGQQVPAGTPIGKVGATGRVTGAHLHFATYLNGVAVDPALLLAEEE
jgi:murein DD-endopeptidase MepM/ murein hydrolase activator NlpD